MMQEEGSLSCSRGGGGGGGGKKKKRVPGNQEVFFSGRNRAFGSI